MRYICSLSLPAALATRASYLVSFSQLLPPSQVNRPCYLVDLEEVPTDRRFDHNLTFGIGGTSADGSVPAFTINGQAPQP